MGGILPYIRNYRATQGGSHSRTNDVLRIRVRSGVVRSCLHVARVRRVPSLVRSTACSIVQHMFLGISDAFNQSSLAREMTRKYLDLELAHIHPSISSHDNGHRLPEVMSFGCLLRAVCVPQRDGRPRMLWPMRREAFEQCRQTSKFFR